MGKYKILDSFLFLFFSTIISFDLKNITLQTKDGEIKSSDAYKSRQGRDDVSEVWNPFIVGTQPGRLRRVRRRPVSPQEPSFWSWFLIFKRLFHN